MQDSATRIPVAAGFAGGSADAAAVLRGMNQLFALGASDEELCALGAKLGSDIPFTLLGGTMLATGRGEKLERLPDMPTADIVLAKPLPTQEKKRLMLLTFRLRPKSI